MNPKTENVAKLKKIIDQIWSQYYGGSESYALGIKELIKKISTIIARKDQEMVRLKRIIQNAGKEANQ